MATTHAHSGGCCGGADHGHGSEYDGVDVANDPTLMSCCEKDALAFDRAMELKSFLTANDPSTQNVRLRQQIILPPPETERVATSATAGVQAAMAASAMAEKLKELDIEDSDSDDDFDDDFDDILASRRQELAKQFEEAAKNAADGYGIILESNFQALMNELKASPEVPRVALVWPASVDGDGAQSMLKEMLDAARRFLGTKFYSVRTSASDSDTLRELRLSRAPSIVAFRNGQRVDASVIDQKDLAATASIAWEAKLLPWLTMCGVLETNRQDRQPRAASSTKRPSKQTAFDELAFDCGISGCRIRFSYDHEHVGPSQESKREISAWRSTAET